MMILPSRLPTWHAQPQLGCEKRFNKETSTWHSQEIVLQLKRTL